MLPQFQTILQSEDPLKVLEPNVDSLNIEAVPLLVHFAISSSQSLRDFAISRLKVIVNKAENVVTEFTKVITPFSKEDKDKKIEKQRIWNQPKIDDIQGIPLIELSLHIFMFSFEHFDEAVQLDLLNVLISLYKNESFVPSTRIMLDTLLILPLFLLRADSNKNIGFSLLQTINDIAEKSCDTKVLVATKSLYLMFN